MKLNSSQLEAFFTVAKLLNFTKAAQELNVTQSALSQRIARLEEELEATLFIRDRNSIRITDTGEQLLRYCRLANSAESELLGKLKNSKHDFAGSIRIGGFSSINRSLVIPSLKKVMKKNPRLSIQLITKEIAELSSLLRSGEADYILTNKKSDSPDIESLFLGIEENVLVKLKKSLDSDIFLDHDERNPTTKGYFTQNKIPFKPASMRYLDDVYGLIDGVKNGYGKAILPIHLIENDSTLEVIEPKKSLKVSVYLQYFIQPYYRQVHDILIEEIQTYFRYKLSQEL
jgi:DNA-binding transcriptional LysR family regulator